MIAEFKTSPLRPTPGHVRDSIRTRPGRVPAKLIILYKNKKG